MSISYLTKNGAFGDTSPSSITGWANLVADRLVILTINTNDYPRAGGAPYVTGLGTPDGDLTLAKYIGDTGAEGSAEIWYWHNTTTQNISFTVPNLNSSDIYMTIGLYSIGAGKTIQISNTYSDYGDSADPYITTGTEDSDTLLIETLFSDFRNAISAQSHTLLYSYDFGAANCATQYTITSSSGTVNMGFTQSSDGWQMLIAGFVEYDPSVSISLNKVSLSLTPKALADIREDWVIQLNKVVINAIAKSLTPLKPTIALNTLNDTEFSEGNVSLEFTGTSPDSSDITYEVEVSKIYADGHDLRTMETGPSGSYLGTQAQFYNDGYNIAALRSGSPNTLIAVASLSTAYDISTMGTPVTYSIPGTSGSWYTQLQFKPDGSKFYIYGYDSAYRIHEISLSTPWDFSTMSYSTYLDIGTETGYASMTARGFGFSSDGTSIYICVSSSETSYISTIHQFPLSTPYDISTVGSLIDTAAPDSGDNSYWYFVRFDQGGKYIVHWSSNSATYEGLHLAVIKTDGDLSSFEDYTNVIYDPITDFASYYTALYPCFSPDGTVLILRYYYSFTLDQYINLPITTKKSNADSGFTNTEDQYDTDPFTSGEKIALDIDLDVGDYIWIARAGSTAWGEWSSSRSFSVTAVSAILLNKVTMSISPKSLTVIQALQGILLNAVQLGLDVRDLTLVPGPISLLLNTVDISLIPKSLPVIGSAKPTIQQNNPSDYTDLDTPNPKLYFQGSDVDDQYLDYNIQVYGYRFLQDIANGVITSGSGTLSYSGSMSAFAIDENYIYMATSGSSVTVYRISKATMQVTDYLIYDSDHQSATDIIYDDNYIYVSTDNLPGRLMRINRSTFTAAGEQQCSGHWGDGLSQDSTYIYWGTWVDDFGGDADIQIRRYLKSNFTYDAYWELTGLASVTGIRVFQDANYVYGWDKDDRIYRLNKSNFSTYTYDSDVYRGILIDSTDSENGYVYFYRAYTNELKRIDLSDWSEVSVTASYLETLYGTYGTEHYVGDQNYFYLIDGYTTVWPDVEFRLSRIAKSSFDTEILDYSDFVFSDNDPTTPVMLYDNKIYFRVNDYLSYLDNYGFELIVDAESDADDGFFCMQSDYPFPVDEEVYYKIQDENRLPVEDGYYWRVRSKDLYNYSDWSSYRYFDIVAGSGVIYLEPVVLRTNVLNTNIFGWPFVTLGVVTLEVLVKTLEVVPGAVAIQLGKVTMVVTPNDIAILNVVPSTSKYGPGFQVI